MSTLGTMTDLHSRVLALLKTSAGNLLMLMTQGHCSSSYEDTFGNNLECHKKVELKAFFFFNARISRCGSTSAVSVVIYIYVYISLNVNFEY